MPRYFFNLKTGRSFLRDFDGTDLDDDTAARGHAETMAREIMRNNEVKSRVWRLEVCNSRVDETMNHLTPDLRESVRVASGQLGSLSDALADVRMSIRELRATLAQTSGRPYLIAIDGRRIADG